MTYDLSRDLDLQKFTARVAALLTRQACVDLTEKAERSLKQNAYLHLVIGVVAMETGNTIAYTKDAYFKRLANPDIFVLRRHDRYAGGEVTFLRSSADLTKEEMSLAIDRFKRWAAEQGIYIPDQEDTARLLDIEMELGRMKQWL